MFFEIPGKKTNPKKRRQFVSWIRWEISNFIRKFIDLPLVVKLIDLQRDGDFSIDKD